MSKKNKSKRTYIHIKEKKYKKKIYILTITIFLIIIIYFIYEQILLREKEGLNEIFNILEEQGFTVNVGLSGVYKPGNIVQIIETGSDGKQFQITPPLVLLWGSDCFSMENLKKSRFVLPEFNGTRSASLKLGVDIVNRLLPFLKINNFVVADYNLKLEDVTIHTFAKADLSHNFSAKCVNSLKQALRDGDKIGWFSVIVEAVVVNSFIFAMQWETNTSVKVRNEVGKKIERKFNEILMQHTIDASEVNVGAVMHIEENNKTLFEAKGPIILGYKTRPLKPVYAE